MATPPPARTGFQQIWDSQRFDETTLGMAYVETILPDTLVWSGSLELDTLPTLEIGPQGPEARELTVTSTLGEGGMGVVRAARQLSLGREVAVKSARTSGGRRASNRDLARRKLLQEAWMTGQLEHPNIVPIHQLGRDEHGDPILVMKLVEGVAWRKILLGEAEIPGPHPIADDPLAWNLRVLMQVCNAVELAHSKGIVHRDLKPGNVMIGAFGEVYLLDWGIAVALDDDNSGRLPLAREIRTIAGTPSYMAPEMTDADGAGITRATDVYLLGAILVEIITGAPPHGGDSLFSVLARAYENAPLEFGDEVPAELAQICRMAMSRQPAQRHESPSAFAQALATYLQHRSSTHNSAEAVQRLDELRALLTDRAGVDRGRVYELFGQCRFGFQQALRTHAANEQALEGLGATTERMVQYELEQGDVGAAATLIEQLPATYPRLQATRDALRSQVEDKRRSIRQLEQMQSELDLDVAIRNRIILVVVLGILWGVISVLTGVIARAGIREVSHLELIVSEAAVVVSLVVILGVWRKKLLKNKVNYRLAGVCLLTFLGCVAMAVVGAIQGAPINSVVVWDMAIMFLGTASMAVAIDVRLTGTAVVYLAALCLSAWLEPYAWEIAGVCDMLAGISIAVLWRMSPTRAAGPVAVDRNTT